jgi:LysE type translocator.
LVLKKSLPHLLGIAFGFPIMLIVVGLGLDVLIAQSPIFHTIVKVLGIGYLLYLAFKLFTTTKRSSIEGWLETIHIFSSGFISMG